MDLNSLMVNDGPSIYYDVGMRNVLEDNLEYLRTHPNTRLLSVEASAAYQNTNDLQGLFHSMRIPAHLHWLVMRLNHFTSFNSSLEGTLLLVVPDEDDVARIVQSHMTVSRIN